MRRSLVADLTGIIGRYKCVMSCDTEAQCASFLRWLREKCGIEGGEFLPGLEFGEGMFDAGYCVDLGSCEVMTVRKAVEFGASFLYYGDYNFED